MKKLSIILVIILLITGLAFGGGKKEAAPAGDAQKGTAQTAEAAKKSVTLTVALMSADIPEATQKYLDAFSAAYPYIKVDYVDVGNSVEEYLQPKAAAGVMPDFFSINGGSFGGDLVDKGMIADLSGTDAAKNTIDSVKPQFTSAGGKLFGIAGGVSSSLIYYNKDLFDKLGVKPAENWEDFLILCEKIKKAGYTPLIITPADGTISNTCFSHGFANNVAVKEPDYVNKIRKGTLNLNTPEFAEVYNMVKVLFDKGYTQEGALSTEYLTGNNMYVQGKAAMHFAGTWLAGTLLKTDFNTEVFMAPWNKKSVKKIPIVATETGWGVAEGPHKAEALLLLNWLNGPGFTMYQNPRKCIPHLKKVEGNVILAPEIVGFLDELYKYDKTAGLWFEYLPAPVMPLTYKFYQEMLIGEKTPAQIAKEFDAALKDVVKK